MLVNIGLGNGLVPDGTLSHYLNQCWNIVYGVPKAWSISQDVVSLKWAWILNIWNPSQISQGPMS